MSYEINILVINQERPVCPPFESSIQLRNEVEHQGFARYFSHWPFFSCIKGIRYTLVRAGTSDCLSSFYLCDADFEASCLNASVLSWVSEEYQQDFLCPLIIKDEVYRDFVNVLAFLLENSPNGFIMFQTRYQGGDRDVILGTISLEQFLSMLNKREIMFNTCYIIAK